MDAPVSQVAAPTPAPPQRPFGFSSMQVDKNGRGKLPAKVRDFFKEVRHKSNFITLLDGKIVVYSNGSWDDQLALLESGAVDPEIAYDITFIADKYGSPFEIDDEGKFTFSQKLRQAMPVTDATVYMRFDGWILKFYTQEQFDEEDRRATERLAENLKAAKAKGLKT